jgi:soluble lytic murein transglycosylase-like protein
MQLMPKTAQAYGVTNVFDPVQNINGGVSYLSDLTDYYSNFGDNATPYAVAAYNAGPGTVNAYIDYGKPLPLETVNYVWKVLGVRLP